MDHVIDQAQDSEQKTLAMLYFKDEDSQHFVVESSSTKEDSAILISSDPELNASTVSYPAYPNVNIVSNTRAGIYRLQIEIDMTKGGYNDY